MASSAGTARLIAVGRLELDDLGAELGEQPCAVGPGDHAGQIEHSYAVQRPVAAGVHRHVEAPWATSPNGWSCSVLASRGRPRTFSPKWLRWISSVPPAIDVAGLDSAKS